MFEPTREDRFAFGLWTVGNRGADPFGPVVRPRTEPTEIVARLAELGAWGVSLHDNDLVPIDTKPADRDRIVREFKQALQANGMVCSMATVNLFSHPVFRDGAFTARDPAVRRYALQKAMAAVELGVELGARIFVLWGGREGSECDAGKDAREALARYREALNFLTHWLRDRRHDMVLALEAKPNEPRGDLYLPTTGAMLAFIATLDHPDMVGVNPEVAHETMAGLNFYHVVAQAVEAKKLFHIDLNDQKIGRYDQDLRFGSADPRGAFFLVKLLEESGYRGPRHFDAHAYRTEDVDGVWRFAAGCMRTYKILQHKARQFAQDREIQALVRAMEPTPQYRPEVGKQIASERFDLDALAARGADYERLDQLVMDLLLGARG